MMATKKSSVPTPQLPIPVEVVERRIYLIRGQKVMLDSDLAELYEVETRALNQAVKRNHDRFPEDFMFELSAEEAEQVLRSRSQTVTLKRGQNIKYLPKPSLSWALQCCQVSSEISAVQVNIAIMRAFVKLREMLLSNEDLNRKFADHERKLATHDTQFKVVFDELRKLIAAGETTTADWFQNNREEVIERKLQARVIYESHQILSRRLSNGFAEPGRAPGDAAQHRPYAFDD